MDYLFAMTQTMKPTVFSVFLLALASCGPLPVYYRDGSDQTRTNSDVTNCQVAALKAAPIALETRQHPPTYYPAERHCDGDNCWVRPGYWVPGQIYTVDLNEALRQRVEQNCMAQKGYQRLELPRCDQAEIAALSSQEGPGGLTPYSCALRQKDGNTIILPPL